MHRTPMITLAIAAALLIAPAARAQMSPYGGMGELGGFEPASVAKLSDSDATCEQLYAEATHLENRVAAMPKPEDVGAISQKMTEEIMASQQKAMQSARARGMASSVLGMVPGVGGLAAQALSPGLGSMRNDTSEQMQKHMQAMQESTQASMAIYQLQARQQHLTDLFLDRQCKVSQLDANAVARARLQWEPAGAAIAEAGAAPPQAPQAAAGEVAADATAPQNAAEANATP